MALSFNPLVFAGLDKTGSGGTGPEGPAGPKGEFNFTGAWTAKAARTKGDAVTRNGSLWGCVKTVTEGEDKEPGTDATIWKLLAEKGAAGAEGPKGTTGLEGPAGQGVPTGGTTGQVLAKKTNTNFDDEWVTPSGGAPSGAAGGDLEGTYPNPGIGAEKVVTAKIKALNVTTGTLAEGAVTNIKIGAEAVETAKVKDKAITDKKLAGLTWETVEAINAKLEITVTIQVAVFNGLVFMRGLGKVSAEIAAKGILFTLPAAARPATQRQALYGTEAKGSGTSFLVVKTNGECETAILLAAGKLPNFDSIVFSL